MKEKIGEVTLDYQYYGGQDLYSDGDIEDELLEAAIQNGDSDYNPVIAGTQSWTYLYHFSEIRQNVISWIPMSGQEDVLEIGSGCGAITGMLAQKAGSVTCIELSRKRSRINANRNRNCRNVTIRVGNFETIQEHLEQKFDLITLIGVFEYGQSYIQGEQPYEEFLRIVRKHLKPHGKLVIAIENKFGMKYWAGCKEDHFGTFFEGIEGYPQGEGVRTFSRPELEKMLQNTGFADWEFYYPYPDYKFPMKIYSDEYLPARGELKENFQNFDRSRMYLFDETKAFDTVTGSGLFPLFSNSYLILAENGEEEV
jgi:SAM-dependent methyltransferase